MLRTLLLLSLIGMAMLSHANLNPSASHQASSIETGKGLHIQTGGNLNLIASTLKNKHGKLHLKAGKHLNLASVQNRQSSGGSGSNMSSGVGSDAIPNRLGAGKNHHHSQRTWTDEQTQLIGTKSIRVKAKKLHNQGALIANATLHPDGTLKDKGKLDWQVANYSESDLQNSDQSDASGFNANISLNKNGSTTLGAHRQGHDRQGQTLATIGKTQQGKQVGANQHLNRSQRITKDHQTGGLNASLSVDHRLLSKDGRKEIKEDFLKSGMMADAAQQVIETDKVDLLGFNKQLGIQHNSYEGVKEAIAKDPQLQQALTDPNLTAEQKQAMYQKTADAVMIKLGYKTAQTHLIDSTEKGRDDKVRGHYGEDKAIHLNDKHLHNTGEGIHTLGHEMAHAMDDQKGTFKAGDQDQNRYATNYGKDLSNYANFASTHYGKGKLANTNQRKGNQHSPLINKNNQAFKKLDKSKGDDQVFHTPGTFAQANDVEPSFKQSLQVMYQDNKPIIVIDNGGNLKNNKEDREKLAKKVVQTIIEYHQKNPNEPIRLTGHSHGGNVNKLVTQMLVEKGHSKLIDNLLFLGTPVRDDYKLNHQAVKTGKDAQGKNRVQNAYDKDDWVQKNGGNNSVFSPSWFEFGEAGQTVNDPKVKNVEVDAPGQGGGQQSIRIWTRQM